MGSQDSEQGVVPNNTRTNKSDSLHRKTDVLFIFAVQHSSEGHLAEKSDFLQVNVKVARGILPLFPINFYFPKPGLIYPTVTSLVHVRSHAMGEEHPRSMTI